MKLYYCVEKDGCILVRNKSEGLAQDTSILKFWEVDTEDRFTLIKALVEAQKMGADEVMLNALKRNNNVINEDYVIYARLQSGEKLEEIVKEMLQEKLLAEAKSLGDRWL